MLDGKAYLDGKYSSVLSLGIGLSFLNPLILRHHIRDLDASSILVCFSLLLIYGFCQSLIYIYFALFSITSVLSQSFHVLLYFYQS